MSGKGNDFWLDDPDWANLLSKQNGKLSAKLSRAQRKQLKEAQFQATLKAQQAQAAAQQPSVNATIHEARNNMRTANTRPNQYNQRYSAHGASPRNTQSQVPTTTSTQPVTKEGTKSVNVSLNLTLPHINLGPIKKHIVNGYRRVVPTTARQQVKSKYASLSRKQRIIGASALVVVLVAVLGSFVLFGDTKNNPAADTKDVLGKQTVTIDFKPLLPNGSESETSAHKTAVDGQNRPIYTFTDKIGITDLTVTEQPLPEKLKTNTDSELEKMAKDLYLTEVINASNPKAYMGTSIKGPQTVIFTKNGLLVFVQSQAKIDKDQWSDYITRLVP